MEYTLRTDRLSLRTLQDEDAQMIWPYVSDPAISKDMSWLPHSKIDDTQAFIDSTLGNMKLGKCITWCIFIKGSFCGIFSLIGILKQHRSLIYNRAELAYWLGPEFQGKGIMTEAGKSIIDFAFNELGLHKLVVGHHINNEHSRKLILRLGFNYLYTEEEVFMKNNEWVTCQFYQLKASDYLKK